MSDGEVDGHDIFDEIIGSDPLLAVLTLESVTKALEGFALTPLKDMTWLADHVKKAVVGGRNVGGDSSNRETRNELLRLARLTTKTWLKLQTRSGAADSALYWEASSGDPRNVTHNDEPDEFSLCEPHDYRAFSAALGHLETIPDILHRAATALSRQTQKPRWPEKLQRSERIRVAYCLSSVFEQAFGSPAKPNSWATAYGIAPPWQDFYIRVMSLALPQNPLRDVDGVLFEAWRQWSARDTRV